MAQVSVGDADSVIARRLLRALGVADSRVLKIGASCPRLESETNPARDRHAVSDGITPDGQPTVVVDVDEGVLIGVSPFARPAPTRLGFVAGDTPAMRE